MLHKVEKSYIRLFDKNVVTRKEIAQCTDHTRNTIRQALKGPTNKEDRRKDMRSIVDKYEEGIKRWIR